MNLSEGIILKGVVSLDPLTFDKVISSNQHHVLVRFDAEATDGANEILFGEIAQASAKGKNLLTAEVKLEKEGRSPELLELAKSYNAENVPVFILFFDGKEVSRYRDGNTLTDKTKLIEWLTNNGIELTVMGATLPYFNRLFGEYFSSQSSDKRAELLKKAQEAALSDEFKEHDLVKFFPTILEKASVKGDDYCSKEIERISSMLEKKKDSINKDKRAEMTKKLKVLEVCKEAVENASKASEEL